MKLSEFSAGVSVGKIRIGADAAGVRKILGDEEALKKLTDEIKSKEG